LTVAPAPVLPPPANLPWTLSWSEESSTWTPGTNLFFDMQSCSTNGATTLADGVLTLNELPNTCWAVLDARGLQGNVAFEIRAKGKNAPGAQNELVLRDGTYGGVSCWVRDTAWHTYRVERVTGTATWYVDGQAVLDGELTGTGVGLTLAVMASTTAGPIGSLDVDYVRAYTAS